VAQSHGAPGQAITRALAASYNVVRPDHGPLWTRC